MMESDREQRKRWTIGRSRLTYYGSIADGGNLRRRGGGFGIFEDKIPAFRSMDGVEPSEGGFMRRNFLKDTTGRSLLWGVGVILFWSHRYNEKWNLPKNAFSAENFASNLFLFPLSFNKERLVCKCEANFMQYTWFISDTNGHLTKLEAFPMWNELLSIIPSRPSEKCTQASGMSSPTNVDDFLEIFKQPLTHPSLWHNMLQIFRKVSTFAFLPWSYFMVKCS